MLLVIPCYTLRHIRIKLTIPSGDKTLLCQAHREEGNATLPLTQL